MNKNLVCFVVSILSSVICFYVITQDASLGANVCAGAALFCGGWSACYRSGNYLGAIKEMQESPNQNVNGR